MATLKAPRAITHAEKEALLKKAVHVQHEKDERQIPLPAGSQQQTRTLKTRIHVPVEESVQVPVVRKEAQRGVETKVVKGTKLIPVKKFKEVQETTFEVQEEVVHGYKEVWKKVREPITETVKKRVPVTKIRKIPYMDYETREVETVVEVPKEVVKTRKGYRLDKHVGSKVYEVQEDHVYEVRPVPVQKLETRASERHGEFEHHGKTRHGAPVWDGHAHDGWQPHLAPPTPPFHRSASVGQIPSRPATAYSRPGTGLSVASSMRSHSQTLLATRR